jgi:hypothetical protein
MIKRRALQLSLAYPYHLSCGLDEDYEADTLRGIGEKEIDHSIQIPIIDP